MDEVDELLDGIYVRAKEIQHAHDPEMKLRQLLAPVRALLMEKLRQASDKSVASFSNSNTSFAVDSGPLSYISGAATKLQTMVARSPPSQGLSTLRHNSKSPGKPLQTYFNGAANRLHALVTGNKTLSIDTMKGKQQHSEAVIRIQALVRGNSQRQILSHDLGH